MRAARGAQHRSGYGMLCQRQYVFRHILGLLLVLLGLIALTACRVSGNSLVDSNRKASGFMIPLRQKSHPGWRRHLLRSGVMTVQGSTRELGYYYATLALGTPARSYSLIIDTGSTITYVPCTDCQRCGQHTSERFDPSASSTARRLDCSDPLCDCGRPACVCASPGNQCYYRRAYAEGSTSEGFLLSDVMAFPDPSSRPGPPPRLVFGCIRSETGELFHQQADGLVGMGNSQNAMQSQLVERGVIEDVFSLCFGFPKDGVMLLGDVPLPLPPGGSPTVFTPLLTSLHLNYYNVRVEGISVAGEQLPLDASIFERGYGVVLDSGTTFTYLPSAAFEAMSRVIGEFAESRGLRRTPGADPQYDDVCWRGAPAEPGALGSVFPEAQFVFGGGAVLRLPPVRYLFLSRPALPSADGSATSSSTAEYCLSFFDNGGAGTLIGTGSVLDVVVTYDRRSDRVGFTDMSCADLAAALGGSPSSPSSEHNATVVPIFPPPPPPSPRSPSPRPPPPPPDSATSGDPSSPAPSSASSPGKKPKKPPGSPAPAPSGSKGPSRPSRPHKPKRPKRPSSRSHTRVAKHMRETEGALQHERAERLGAGLGARGGGAAAERLAARVEEAARSRHERRRDRRAG